MLAFAGPYCLAVLWYHWARMRQFSFVTQATFVLVIGLNSLLFTGDVAFGVYWVYCRVTGQDAKKWYKDFMKRERREKRRLRRMGYRNVNDLQALEQVSDDTDSDEDEVSLGQTTKPVATHTELTQRVKDEKKR